jgi:signal transduction histidine kinase
MLNGIEAMKEIGIGDLTIESQQHGNRQLLISIGDTGRGGRAGQAAQVFNAFFSTKPQGTGMGLPISKSMVESLMATVCGRPPNPDRGDPFSSPSPSEAP